MPEFGQRNDGISGRRLAARAPVLLPAEMTTTLDSEITELLSISATGAQLRGAQLPEVGRDVLIRFEGVEAFGTVVWSNTGTCGVHFDEPLKPLELRQVVRVSVQCLRAKITPDQRLAADAWSSGFVR